MNPVKALALAFVLSLPVCAEDAGEKKEPETAKTPEDAWSQFQQAIGRKDKDRIWALLSKASREALEKELGARLKLTDPRERKEMAEELGITVEEYDKLTERELVLVMVLKSAEDPANDLLKVKVKDIKIDGDAAAGKRQASADEKDEETTDAFFLKEDGEWKLDIKRELEAQKEEAAPPPDEPPPDGK
jgi:hypothetical protein